MIKPLYNLSCLAYYQLNVEYITAKFCENKEKVELSCAGKCHLAKQLKVASSQEEDDKAANSIQEIFSLVFLQKSFNYNIKRITFLNHTDIYPSGDPFYFSAYNYKCFRPPIV